MACEQQTLFPITFLRPESAELALASEPGRAQSVHHPVVMPAFNRCQEKQTIVLPTCALTCTIAGSRKERVLPDPEETCRYEDI
eukprot:766764-Hanusia_phi.AAC.5